MIMTTETDMHGHGPDAAEMPHGTAKDYAVGLAFALILTAASFWASSTNVIYGPGIPILLAVLAIAQMGVHLVFFIRISSAPDQTNNFLALIFGIFVVGLVVFGSLFIMTHLHDYMTPATQTSMQMQH